MDFNATYYVGEAFTRHASRVKEVGDLIGKNDIALACGDWTPPERIRFSQYEGTNWFDCVGAQRANVKIVSARIVDAFREAGLRGWDTYDIELKTKKGTPMPGYSGLIVRGRCGPIDNTRSVRIEKIVAGNPKGHASVWKGLYFDDTIWDGTDVFRPARTGFIFVTQKVKDVLDQIGATNISVTPLADFERPMLI